MSKQADQTSGRMENVGTPRTAADGLNFETLFAGIDIQKIQDQFSAATGVAAIITHPDGTPITRPSNFCRLCSDIIRRTENGRSNCYKSDALIGRHHPEGPVVLCCLSGGLWDAGASITVNGQHIANWLIGQVRNDTQSDEAMRVYARTIGADEDAFMQAYYEVPVMSQERFNQIARFLFTMANELSAKAFNNLQQTRLIHELKNADDQLDQTNARFLSIADNLSGYIASVNASSLHYEFVNKTFETSFGIPREKIVGSHIREIIGEENYQFALRYINIVRSGQAVSYENYFDLVNGPRWIQVNYNPVFDQHRQVKSIVVLSSDITDRKQMEESLRDSEFFFKESQRAAYIGSYKADFVAGYWESSEILDQIFGISSDYQRTIPGWIDIVHPDDQQMMGEYLQNEVIGKKRPFNREYRIIRKSDGQLRWVHGLGEVRSDSDGNVTALYGTIQDITDRKRAETEHHRLQVQLNQSQKMESIGQLAGGVAHNFNNMLSVILGHADFALKQLDPDHPLFTDLDAIRSAAENSALLTNQLLAFARKQQVTSQPLNLNQTIEKALKMIRPLFREEIQLTWNPDPAPLIVTMDPVQIDQVLINLCINARDSITGNGLITISTSTCSKLPEHLSDQIQVQATEYVVLTVSDNGRGIPEDTLNKIFDPFFTTKEMGQGTGLGLASVYGTIKQNNGLIDVSSSSGKGTTFTIYLPATQGVAQTATNPGSTEANPKGSETILVVEDNVKILVMCQKFLQKQGYRVLTAETPSQAIQIARSASMHIDLLLSDILLPEMRGPELAGQLLARNPDLKCLFMSGYHRSKIDPFDATVPEINFIQKPFRVHTLITRVREVLDH